ncbi:hypothetical protein MJO28_009418 [Puccinia striiformis f. sp. tritici]|uniref:Uncharacterized protein n=1 Tax=Puccinia striiformis f. sp. tritici TaxID=168172 RepID=A0ACC0E960_9BASI|nr:hypothetical protein MJO28_009418 [Puccinia striiformis f. sp. tritici]
MIRPKKRRANKMKNYWARQETTTGSSFVDSSVNLESTKDDDVNKTITAAPVPPAEKIHYYYVPKHRQHDPNLLEIFTRQETLLNSYHKLDHGTCIIAPKKEPGFCKFKITPFSNMSPEQPQGWEKLVMFFLERTDFVEEVKINGPHTEGGMWACGWRKGSKRKEGFGRYCSFIRLAAMIRKSQYNAQDEEAAYREANEWIASHLQELAPQAFKEDRQALLENGLPSMGHTEYNTPYNMFNFASFFTFTMFNFSNDPHKDTDVNNWTMACWIPFFNPKTSNPDDPILADEGFDMEGGQFTFRDFQVYIDMNRGIGVTMCVFRSTKENHQTLNGCSRSNKYTRIGFSCQMSQRMTNAMVAYLTTKTDTQIAGQTMQIDDAIRYNEKKKQEKIEKQKPKQKQNKRKKMA